LLLGGPQVVEPPEFLARNLLRLGGLLLAATEQATAAARLLAAPVVVGPVGTAGSHC
jgi:hypothetical protein